MWCDVMVRIHIVRDHSEGLDRAGEVLVEEHITLHEGGTVTARA